MTVLSAEQVANILFGRKPGFVLPETRHEGALTSAFANAVDNSALLPIKDRLQNLVNLGLHPNLVTQIRATYQFFGAQILQRKFLSASGIVKHMNETPFTFHPEYRLGFMATDQKFSDLTTGNFQDILYKTCLDHFRVIVKENPLIFMRGVDPNHSVVLN